MAENWKERLKAILQKEGNNKCADCQAANPTWAVYNIGVFLCINCAGIHRQLGVHISKVRSTELDAWNEEQINGVINKGNIICNEQFEERKPKFYITPNECPLNEIRKKFIIDKYQNKLFMNSDDMKQDPSLYDMPQKVLIGEFWHENNKKKVYLQLLANYLYYFRYNHDSYSFEHYDVSNLKTFLTQSNFNQNEIILMITQNDDTLFRLRLPPQDYQFDIILEWAHSIRRSTQFYSLKIGKELLECKPKITEPLNEIKMEDLNNEFKVLGFASKKGGGVQGYKRRWWILHSHYLYYFKEDFTKMKKNGANVNGVPQGYIDLIGGDIVWDDDRKRTGKAQGCLIITPKRTFYIATENQNKDLFYNSISDLCSKLLNRKSYDFGKL